MSDHDVTIGSNVWALREVQGMSQLALAAAMAERGFNWHQTTVCRVESGTRPVRLAEATDLGDILEAPIGLLIDDPAEVALRSARWLVAERQHKCIIANQQLDEAVADLARLEAKAVSS